MTTDNTTSNDTMIEELADKIALFNSEPNYTRCFAHTINLVVKTVLHQFDVDTKKSSASSKKGTNELNEIEVSLQELAQGLNLEDQATLEERLMEGKVEKDNVDGWIDETQLLSDQEWVNLRALIILVKCVLVKASLGQLGDCGQGLTFW